MDIVQECINWNEARYDKVFDEQLSKKLLCEEMNELFTPTNQIVDMLDAVGDVTFVTIGCMWKLDYDIDEIRNIFYGIDLRNATLEERLDWIDPYQEEWIYPALHMVFVSCIGILQGLKMQGAFYNIVEAICESNNTKVIKGKTPSHIKANIDKGANYVPPTKKLIEIYSLYFTSTVGVA